MHFNTQLSIFPQIYLSSKEGLDTGGLAKQPWIMIWQKGCNLHDPVWNWQSKSKIMQKFPSQNAPCLLNSCVMPNSFWGNLHDTLACRNHTHTQLPDLPGTENNKITYFQRQSYSWAVVTAVVGCWRAILLHIQRLPFAVALCLWYSHCFPLTALQVIWCPGFLKFCSLINQDTFANCSSSKVDLALLTQPAVFSMEELSSICCHLNQWLSLASTWFFVSPTRREHCQWIIFICTVTVMSYLNLCFSTPTK